MTLDHIVLYVSDLKQSERFYSTFLELSSKEDDSIVYQIGTVLLFIAEKENQNNDFDKKNIGLNHLAFGVTSMDELKEYKKKLNNLNIKHSGIQIDTYGGKEFIWFDDPDGMRLEFYLRKE